MRGVQNMVHAGDPGAVIHSEDVLQETSPAGRMLENRVHEVASDLEVFQQIYFGFVQLHCAGHTSHLAQCSFAPEHNLVEGVASNIQLLGHGDGHGPAAT